MQILQGVLLAGCSDIEIEQIDCTHSVGPKLAVPIRASRTVPVFRLQLACNRLRFASSGFHVRVRIGINALSHYSTSLNIGDVEVMLHSRQ